MDFIQRHMLSTMSFVIQKTMILKYGRYFGLNFGDTLRFWSKIILFKVNNNVMHFCWNWVSNSNFARDELLDPLKVIQGSKFCAGPEFCIKNFSYFWNLEKVLHVVIFCCICSLLATHRLVICQNWHYICAAHARYDLEIKIWTASTR